MINHRLITESDVERLGVRGGAVDGHVEEAPDEASVERVRPWIRTNFRPSKTIAFFHPGSHVLKHEAEEALGESVANGELIIAAMREGIQAGARKGSPNAYFGMVAIPKKEQNEAAEEAGTPPVGLKDFTDRRVKLTLKELKLPVVIGHCADGYTVEFERRGHIVVRWSGTTNPPKTTEDLRLVLLNRGYAAEAYATYVRLMKPEA